MTPRFGMGAPSPAALRMRRSRERRRQGDVMVSLDVGPSVTADLVALGWLAGPDCGDKNALTRALADLIEHAIELRVTTTTGSEGKVSFLCDIQRSTIETLVTFGWLPVDQQDELDSIVKAFRRFAGRALAVARNCGLDQWYIP
jgi:hypothetical protein